MDRNSIIGLLLIGAVLFTFSLFNKPSEEQIKAAQEKQRLDSLAIVEKNKQAQIQQIRTDSLNAIVKADSNATINGDSALAIANDQKYGAFATAADGKEQFFTIENELIKVTLTTKGGKVHQVQLKKYLTFDKKPLILNDGDSSVFGLNFFAQNRSISSDQLFFEPVGNSFSVTGDQQQSFSMRMMGGTGKYIEYIYKLKGNTYRLDFDINFININDLLPSNSSYVELDWRQKIRCQERTVHNERAASTIYYRYKDDEVDYLGETKDHDEALKTKVQWVSFKQQFFTSVLIADDSFDKPTKITTHTPPEENTQYVKYFTANFTIPYSHKPAESFGMSFYFGPNHYKTLKKFDLALEKQIPLGWGIFGWVNRYAVINIFNWLDGFNMNYGLIILILTILIKVALLPLTYKAYLSTAKMKVLKPEVEEIQKKHKEDPLKSQQELMGMYKKAGVNPLGGCFPMLLQMPILIAMFRFFPASIELRQQKFLWAVDLSTYDSIFDFGFKVPFYGDHISLFTILMTISTIMYTRMNSQMTAGTNPQMKWIMYLMPILFLGIFNNYSAGLSYYYFLANMITFGQQFLFRQFVDENAIHAKIQENKKKPTKKSNFQQRLEKMAKERGYKTR